MVIDDLPKTLVENGTLGFHPAVIFLHVLQDVYFHRFGTHEEVVYIGEWVTMEGIGEQVAVILDVGQGGEVLPLLATTEFDALLPAVSFQGFHDFLRFGLGVPFVELGDTLELLVLE
jgi:hypothetical protein